MKLSKSSAAADHKPGCPSYRMVKGWRSNRGYMFAMMLAMLALMAVMGVGLSRLLVTTKATTQMQRSQDNKQLMNSLVMTLSSKAADSDGDFVLEPPAYSTETITGFAAPTNGGFVGTDVVNVDAWGRRLGYCAYDYGSATATPPSGTGLIRGSTNSSPTDSWVAVVVISAGPDGVITTPCPAADTLASDVAATGDDMVAARSYGEMVSFGNAQIASTLSGMGTNNQNKFCRLNDSGKMVCDVVADACTTYQASKWNATSFKFDCINFKPADCAGGRTHSETWSTSCPSGQTGTINYQCLNGVTSQTSAVCYNDCGGQPHGSTWSTSCPSGQSGTIYYQCLNGVASQTSAVCYNNCGGQPHGSTWSVSCPSGQTGNISYQCNNGSITETGSTCATPPPPQPACSQVQFMGSRVSTQGYDWSCVEGAAYLGNGATSISCSCTDSKTEQESNNCGNFNKLDGSQGSPGWKCGAGNGTCVGTVCN